MKIVTLAALLAIPFAVGAVEPNTELDVRFDDGGGEPLHSAAMDIEGNIILSAGRGNSSGATSNSYYVAKFDSFGREQWRRTYTPGTASWFGQSSNITVDRDGNIFMVISQSYNFGGIVKYDRDGNEQVLSLGQGVPSSWEHRVGVELDADGNIYLRAANYLQKFDPAGNQLWNRRFFVHWASWVRDIKVDAAGNVYAVGRGWNSATSSNDAIIAKYDTDGNELWSDRYYSGGNSEAKAMRFDSSGNIVVFGHGMFGAASNDLLTLRYDPAGNQLAVNNYDYGGSDVASDFELDEQDNVYVLGENSNDFLTAKYAPNGQELWSQRLDDSRDDRPMAIDVDVFGNVAVTGSGGYNHYGQQMITIAYDTDGVELWRKKESTGNSFGTWVGFGRTGGVHAAGWTLPNSSGDAVVYRYRLCPCTSCQ